MSDSHPPSDGGRLPELVAVMDRLLAPDGCPWDREQTLQTLIPFLIEEASEVVDAIEHGSPEDHCEELGDLLMQIVFHTALRRREGAFTLDQVVAGICDKLVRRHPHVFGDAQADTSEEVLAQWGELKAREKAAKGHKRRRVLDAVPRGMSPLARAHGMSVRVAKLGFDWPDPSGARAKVDEELGELDEATAAGDRDAMSAELGDVLLATVNLARIHGIDPSAALRDANHRFYNRFSYIEDRLEERGAAVSDTSLDDLDALWQEAKSAT